MEMAAAQSTDDFSFPYEGTLSYNSRSREKPGSYLFVTRCLKCGAENRPGITACRMCSNPLPQPDVSSPDAFGGDSLDTTVVFKSFKTQRGTAGLTECLVCPECQTINQLGWLFCPQCGKKVDSSFLQTMQLADQAPTIFTTKAPDRAPVQSALKNDVGQTESKIVQPAAPKQDDGPLTPRQHPEPLPPPQPAQQWTPPVQPMRQQVEETSGSAQSPNGAPDKSANALAPDSENTVACTECGAENSPDYFFCLSCGGSLPVTKTVVMASIPNRIKPRLRLLMQGGTSGPTYEIKNEAKIGRTEGSITFPHDAFMSTNHARVVKRDADFVLIDETSSNGTFIKVKNETRLEPGDVILVGGQLFRFEA